MQVYWFTLGCLSFLLYFVYKKFLPKVIAIRACVASFILGMIYPLLQTNLSTLQVFTCLGFLVLFVGATISRSHPGWDAKEEAINHESSDEVMPNESTHDDLINITFHETSLSEETSNYPEETVNINLGSSIQQKLQVSTMADEETITNLDFLPVTEQISSDSIIAHKKDNLDESKIIEAEQAVMDNSNPLSEKDMSTEIISRIIYDVVSDDVSSIIPENVSDDIPSIIPEDVSDDVPSIIPEDVSDGIPSIIPEDVSVDIPSIIPEDVSDDVLSIIPEDVSDGIPSIIPEDVSDDFPSIIPDDVSDDVPSIIPEDVLEVIEETQIKRIENFNVLTGPSELFEESSDILNHEELDASNLIIGQETVNTKEETAQISAKIILAEGLKLSKDKQYIPAVKHFNKVIASEPEPEMLYLAISELSSIYQHLGLYPIASDIIVAYVDHSILKYHPGMENLKQKMRFIECLTQLLNKYHYGHIPYDQVPEAVRREAFYNSLNIKTFIS